MPAIDKDMNMKKYARVVDGKVDNIYETVNPISEEFPVDQLWIDVTGKSSAEIDYDYVAVNTGGVWSFNSGFPWPQTALGEQMRIEKARRLDNVMTGVASSGLQFKVDLGVATAAEQAYLLAFKEYCIAFTQVNKQPGFPLSIVWPEVL
ncbi:tail fiber assembly protein [Pseudomonas fluorescens]|nr:tail fiber assembly protein [Pseudomonas fluorescens]